MSEPLTVKFRIPISRPARRTALPALSPTPASLPVHGGPAAASAPTEKRPPCPTPAERSPTPPPAARAARQLALAHYIERLVGTGEIADYAAIARRLDLTRARLTQVVALTSLSPRIQERILDGALRVSERQLRSVLRTADWTEQEEIVNAVHSTPKRRRDEGPEATRAVVQRPGNLSIPTR